MIDAERLRRVALFDRLAPAALGTIAARASTRRYTADETLFAAGERATGIFIVTPSLPTPDSGLTARP